MIILIRTDSQDPDFRKLVRQLDADLSIRDGEDHSFYDQFNKIESIKYVTVAYENKIPVGCGAIKEFDKETMEVKRMFVTLKDRGKGIATKVLSELENWARETGYKRCVLETGKKQLEAIELYRKKGYRVITNYGQYKNVENSVCFQKDLI